MIELSVPINAFGFAPGIADADRIGASAKVQAANPINNKNDGFEYAVHVDSPRSNR